MDVQINQKILQEQKLESIFLVDNQCQQLGHLIIKKTSILYIVENIVLKSFVCISLRELAKNIIDFEKKNVTVNKRRIKI